jgi:peptide methionine sulfoxide reductase MsrA
MNSDKSTGLVAAPVATSVATLGGGCFWCLEAAFLQLKGVESVVSGYAGGAPTNRITAAYAPAEPAMPR